MRCAVCALCLDDRRHIGRWMNTDRTEDLSRQEETIHSNSEDCPQWQKKRRIPPSQRVSLTARVTGTTTPPANAYDVAKPAVPQRSMASCPTPHTMLRQDNKMARLQNAKRAGSPELGLPASTFSTFNVPNEYLFFAPTDHKCITKQIFLR